MKLCVECNSEVADNDLFCPYCGIAMPGADISDSAAEDSFDSTILISASEMASLPVEPDVSIIPEQPIQLEDSIELVPNVSPDVPDLPIALSSLDNEIIEENLPVPEKDGIKPSIDSDTEESDRSESVEAVLDPIDEVPLDLAASDISAEIGTDEPNFAELTTVTDPNEESLPPIEVADDTNSGEISDSSNTTPIVSSANTDGKRSGLKPLSEGTLLNGRYDIARKIGGGGMGAVYLANDRNLGGVPRAVKEMVQSHIEESQQEKAVEDFKRESMILSSLEHPSIPTIYDYFYDELECRFYLVMKYISGGDLAGKLRSAPEGRIDERTTVEWAIQIIDVLDYLHNLPERIVYRDLKPSNVMIDGNSGKVILVDFGIARSINQTQEKGVTAVGTMGYAPPELFSGSVEPRSDIYSLGSTLFHLMTGADPQNNPLLIFDFEKNPRPRQINPQLTDQIEKILMRSVEYNANARYLSAAEMKNVLIEHRSNLDRGHVTYGVSAAPEAVSLSQQLVFCGFCGQRIVATDMFCAFCGSKQPLGQQGVHREIYSSVSATAKLVVIGTNDREAPAYLIEKNENLLGRRDPMSNIFPDVDLSKYDPQTKISRRHAKIWHDGNRFLVEDLGSSNGTLLVPTTSDSTKLTPHLPHPLIDGDRLRIGDTVLHFIVN